MLQFSIETNPKNCSLIYYFTGLRTYSRRYMKKNGSRSLKKIQYGMLLSIVWDDSLYLFYHCYLKWLIQGLFVFQVWASANWWHGSLCIKKWGRICLGLQKLWWRCSKWFTCSRCCNLFQLFGVTHINMVLVPLSECWGHCYILAIFSTSIFANGVFLRELFSDQYFF